ncbi:hypothetical protein LCGC14_1695520 [marine sediment metagenome]|uniref:Phage protein n=1 Tax=marine sediment metagenome TaxID=412755 RepID=A0A0F9KJJ4_9ZZZZ
MTFIPQLKRIYIENNGQSFDDDFQISAYTDYNQLKIEYVVV